MQEKSPGDEGIACHPFYTGTAKFIDTAGRVDKFKAKMAKAKEFKTQADKKSK